MFSLLHKFIIATILSFCFAFGAIAGETNHEPEVTLSGAKGFPSISADGGTVAAIYDQVWYDGSRTYLFKLFASKDVMNITTI